MGLYKLGQESGQCTCDTYMCTGAKTGLRFCDGAHDCTRSTLILQIDASKTAKTSNQNSK